MVQFLVKRFIGLIFVIIGVTFITFILGLNAPGDPIQQLLGKHVIHSVYVSLRHSYGLDLPWYQQYWNFLTNLAHFNWGFRSNSKSIRCGTFSETACRFLQNWASARLSCKCSLAYPSASSPR